MRNDANKEGEEAMKEIDSLRNRLHKSLEGTQKEEILRISKALDVEIVRFMQMKQSQQKFNFEK